MKKISALLLIALFVSLSSFAQTKKDSVPATDTLGKNVEPKTFTLALTEEQLNGVWTILNFAKTYLPSSKAIGTDITTITEGIAELQKEIQKQIQPQLTKKK